MKKQVCTVLVFFTIFVSKVCGQIAALNIGDKCPDLEFVNMVNFGESVAHLSDFKEELIILDFWATYCVPCVKKIPKLDSLQANNKGRLQIIGISQDAKKEIERFYKNAPKLQIPTSVIDSTSKLLQLFPHRYLPHYVCINKDREVVAIANNLSVGMVDSILAGQTIHEFGRRKRNDGIYESSSSLSERRTILYKSILEGYNPHLEQSASVMPYQTFNAINFCRSHLLQIAFGGLDFDYRKVLIELPDSAQFYYPDPELSDIDAEKWKEKNSFCYSLRIPKTENRNDSLLFFLRMQEDLSFYFRIKGSKQIRDINCFVLQGAGNGLLKSKSNITRNHNSIYYVDIKNKSLTSLLSVFRNYLPTRIPFIVESSFSGNIDVNIRCDLRDIEQINEHLKKYNLKLTKQVRRMEVVVIGTLP